MSDDWYCLILGAELGPMPWDELVLLAERGNLQPQHQVRQGEAGDWAPANSVTGLFPSSGAASESASVWYCEVLGVELGPMPWGDLRAMAERGNLQPQHQVRQGEAGAWAPADSFAGLFPSSAASQSSAWYCEVLGAELGPMLWDDLCAMAERGTLSAGSRVRREGADWVAAESVPRLLPKARPGATTTLGRDAAASPIAASGSTARPDQDFETDARRASPSLADADVEFEAAPEPAAAEASAVETEVAPVAGEVLAAEAGGIADKRAARQEEPRQVTSVAPSTAAAPSAAAAKKSGPHPAIAAKPSPTTSSPKSAAKLKKPPREAKPSRASFSAPSIPPGALKVVAVAILVAGIGCAVYFGGGLFGGNNYQVVVNGFDDLYQDVKRLHEQSQDITKLSNVNLQFAKRFASVRLRLKAVDPGTVGEKLNEAGLKLSEMQANAVSAPGSPEEERYQKAEQDYKDLIDMARRQLGQ